jgi:hypothetical protein
MSRARGGRPLVERVLLLLVALGMAAGFFAMGAAAWLAGELPMAIFGCLGGLMTLWAGALTLRGD